MLHRPFRGLENGYLLRSCPELKSKVSFEVLANVDTLKQADAIIVHPVFNPLEWSNTKEFLELKQYRKPHQIITFFQLESPFFHRGDYTRFNNFFNATLTYRFDSTFPAFNLNGDIFDQMQLRSESNIQENMFKILEKPELLSQYKPYGVMIAFSNCRAKIRLNMVERLNILLYPNMNVLGKCSKFMKLPNNLSNKYPEPNLPAGATKSWRGGSKSQQQIFQNYKFYLAFENSRCTDYMEVLQKCHESGQKWPDTSVFDPKMTGNHSFQLISKPLNLKF